MAPRVVVVGAGLIGGCAAMRLAQRGAHVTLLDAGAPGEGTTGSSFAWVDASHPSLAPYVELNVDGLAGWRRLGAALGDPSWLCLAGTLSWETEPDPAAALEAHVTALAELGHRAEPLTRAQARALEPDVTPGAQVETILSFPGEGYVFTRPALADVLALGRDAGLSVRSGARVCGFRIRGDAVCGVALASGEELDADVVVTCVGRWTGDLLAGIDVDVPMISPEPAGSAAVGLLVTTTPVLARLARVLHADGLMVRPDGAGRLMLHGDAQDLLVRHDEITWPLPAPALALVEHARAMLRHADTAAVETARIGIRALPRDRMPVVGPARPGLYVVATHSGITLAPLLGELVTGELIDERQSTALERFRPARFERTVA